MLKITHPPTSLSVKDVTVRYSNGHTAIHDISFHLEGGTICALLGVNGSGNHPLQKHYGLGTAERHYQTLRFNG